MEGWVCERGGSGTGKVNFTIHKQSRHKQNLTHAHSYAHRGKPTHTPEGLTNMED